MSLENLATRIKESATAPPAKLPQKEESKAVDIQEETPQVEQQPLFRGAEDGTSNILPEPDQTVVSDGKADKALAVEKDKKERAAEVESLIVRLEPALESGNYPKAPIAVPGKPWETIIDFEKCAKRQISTYRAWAENTTGGWDYARIVAARIKDLVGILEGNHTQGGERIA